VDAQDCGPGAAAAVRGADASAEVLMSALTRSPDAGAARIWTRSGQAPKAEADDAWNWAGAAAEDVGKYRLRRRCARGRFVGSIKEVSRTLAHERLGTVAIGEYAVISNPFKRPLGSRNAEHRCHAGAVAVDRRPVELGGSDARTGGGKVSD
jgi:hypothetical protein